MGDREIRIRGAASDADRIAVLRCINEYTVTHMNDGRGMGFRHCVVWSWGPVTLCVYHTKTAIVGVYQEASNV